MEIDFKTIDEHKILLIVRERLNRNKHPHTKLTKKKTFLWAMAYFKYSSNENSNGKTIQDSFVLVKICISKVDGKCARISKGEVRIFQASYFDYFQSTKAGNLSLMS